MTPGQGSANAPVDVIATSNDLLPLELQNVTRVYGQGAREVRALTNVNLRIRRGEFVAVMGPSGSGKSTLLTIAGGLETVTSGCVRVDGTDLSSLNPTKLAATRLQRIGYVFQEFNLLPALTAVENVAMPLELGGTNRKEAMARAAEQLGRVGLSDRTEHFPDDLSGGEQQRVAIARALVAGNQLVLADEPTGALDSVTGESVMRTLRASCNEGASAMVVTHDAQLAAWADRVVFLRDGRMIDETDAAVTPEAFLANQGGRR